MTTTFPCNKWRILVLALCLLLSKYPARALVPFLPDYNEGSPLLQPPPDSTGRRDFLKSIPLSLLVHFPRDNAVAATITPPISSNDAIIIGSGLAGLVSALTILDRGGQVVLLEKEGQLGGNSKKASSGINGLSQYAPPGDSLELFERDTYQSHKDPSAEAKQLIDTLVENSAETLKWLESRLDVDVTQVAQLGGHSHPRTHRPKRGMIGATLMVTLFDQLQPFVKTGKAQILTQARAEALLTSSSSNTQSKSIVGVRYTQKKTGKKRIVYAPRTILAAGGFAASKKMLRKYNPALAHLPTTSGPWATGDGVVLAANVGAALKDMSKIQIHPTGFVDPLQPNNLSKVLAAELLRGLGGILLTDQGRRFCNELGTRKYISDKMLAMKDSSFYLVLSSTARTAVAKHVDWYGAKGLLQTVTGVDGLAQYLKVPHATLQETLQSYQKAAASKDEFGKTVFNNPPASPLETEVFTVGQVTPVIHYCMGGLAMNARGQVLSANPLLQPIEGLCAAGEVTGGLHGNNRLGGNSLLECAVFGRIIGQETVIHARNNNSVEHSIRNNKNLIVRDDATENLEATTKNNDLREIGLSELAKHHTANDCWVAIDGQVFDLTEFARQHPGGAEIIQNYAGKDASLIFDAVHAPDLLSSPMARQYQVGVLKTMAAATPVAK